MAAETNAPAEETPKPQRRWLMPAVGVVLLVAGVGVGWFVGGATQAAPAAAGEGEEAAADAAEGEHGAAKEGEKKEEGGHGEAKKEEGGHGEAKEGEKAPIALAGDDKVMLAPDGSAIYALGTFIVNLRGSGGGRLLRMEVALQTTKDVAEGFKVMTPLVRDTINTAVSDYTWAELEGTDGKTRLRDELLTRVNATIAPAKVDRLYFTQFVVQ